MTEPLRLLIVDDDPGHREICRRFLEQHVEYKYDFMEADMGSEGLILCRTSSPDCILLDYRLPDLDGLAFLKALGSGYKDVPFPVIMITGGGNEMLVAEAMQAGVADYLPKDMLSPANLARAITNAVEKCRQRTAIALLRSDEWGCEGSLSV